MCLVGSEGKVDGASPRGLWPPDGGGLCRRVVKRKVLKMDGPSAQGFLSLTALRAEGCGIALGHTFGVKVLKMDRPDGRKVLKFDGLSGRGLWYRPSGDEYIAACQRQALRYNLPALTVILSEAKNLGTQYI